MGIPRNSIVVGGDAGLDIRCLRGRTMPPPTPPPPHVSRPVPAAAAASGANAKDEDDGEVETRRGPPTFLTDFIVNTNEFLVELDSFVNELGM